MLLRILLPTLLLIGFASAGSGKKYIIPPTKIRVVNAGPLTAPMRVTLFTRGRFGYDYKELESVEVDRSGQALFKGRTLAKFGWLAFGFTWEPRGLPPRQMVYEIRSAKGKRGKGGRKIDFKGDQSAYLIGDDRDGDCDNLFEYKEEGDSLTVEFIVPKTYSECRDPGNPINNVNLIGSRDLNKGKLNYYKFSDDMRMGQQFASELQSGKDNPPLNDPLVSNYIKDMVSRIGKASDMPELEIKAEVINADVLNAFAVPGGFIWVYRGLIENTETEAELAGVIAHEIAHVTSRHGTEGMTAAVNKVTLGNLAGQVAAESTDNQWLRQAIGTAVLSGTNFWVVGGTRKREAEADKLGAQYAYRAGYDPMGIATLFGRWAQKKDAPASRLEKYFSDHPADEDRVRAVTNDVGYFLPPKEGLTVSSDAYKRVKARLKQLPRPQQPGEVAANTLFSSFNKINQDLIVQEVGAWLQANQPKK